MMGKSLSTISLGKRLSLNSVSSGLRTLGSISQRSNVSRFLMRSGQNHALSNLNKLRSASSNGNIPHLGEGMRSQDEILMFVVHKHFGQKDKSGEPYLFHVLAVGLMGSNRLERVVGFLHDVIEDTDTTHEDLVYFVGKEIADTVLALTHKKHEPYTEYLERIVAFGGVAPTVKLHDLLHNMSRLDKLEGEVRARLTKKYNKALDFLFHHTGGSNETDKDGE
jgi:(p)ppGpp synthase/HD superfamily hydrolase